MPKKIEDELVFKKTITMVLDRGYMGTTTKELAKDIGINEVSLFRKYGNKLNLIKTSFDNLFSTTPFSSLTYTGDLRQDLKSALISYIETNRIIGDIIPSLLLDIKNNPELKDILNQAMLNVDRFNTIIERYQDEGVLKAGPSVMFVNLLLSPLLLNNMFKQLGLNYSNIELDSFIELCLDGWLM